MLNRNYIEDLHFIFGEYYDLTASHKRRNESDIQMQFMYINYLHELADENSTDYAGLNLEIRH